MYSPQLEFLLVHRSRAAIAAVLGFARLFGSLFMVNMPLHVPFSTAGCACTPRTWGPGLGHGARRDGHLLAGAAAAAGVRAVARVWVDCDLSPRGRGSAAGMAPCICGAFIRSRAHHWTSKLAETATPQNLTALGAELPEPRPRGGGGCPRDRALLEIAKTWKARSCMHAQPGCRVRNAGHKEDPKLLVAQGASWVLLGSLY